MTLEGLKGFVCDCLFDSLMACFLGLHKQEMVIGRLHSLKQTKDFKTESGRGQKEKKKLSNCHIQAQKSGENHFLTILHNVHSMSTNLHFLLAGYWTRKGQYFAIIESHWFIPYP